MAIKYPALISAVIPFGCVAMVAAWRERSPKLVLVYSVAVLVVMAPWLGKNVIDTGNPVYPLGFKVFGGSHWDSGQDAKWAKAHGPRAITLPALTESVLEVAGRSDWQSPLFFALVPLALIAREHRRLALVLLGFVAYIFATWWLFTHRLDRFWLPLVPGLALLAGLGADWSRSRPWTALLGFVMSTSILTNAIYCSTALAGLNDWTGDLTALRGSVPRMLNAPLAGLDLNLPPGAKPLLVGQAAVFHLNRVVAYNTVFNKETIEEISRDRSPDQFREALRSRGITHVYVDWFEIGRYRSPGNYGFTDYVTPERFREWVIVGVLAPPTQAGPGQELFEVRVGGW